MSDLFMEAATILVPFAGAGAEAAARGAAEHGGGRLLDAAGRVLASIRHRVSRRSPSADELAAALRAAFAANEVLLESIQLLVEANSRPSSTGDISVGDVRAHSVVIAGQFIGRDPRGR